MTLKTIKMNWRFFMILLFLASYFIVGIVQIIASIDGILYFFGLHWLFALLAAILLLFIPILGPIAGIYGAVAAWGWSIWSALLLFFWPYILYVILLALGFSAFFWTAKGLKETLGGGAKIIDAEYIVKRHRIK